MVVILIHSIVRGRYHRFLLLSRMNYAEGQQNRDEKRILHTFVCESFKALNVLGSARCVDRETPYVITWHNMLKVQYRKRMKTSYKGLVVLEKSMPIIWSRLCMNTFESFRWSCSHALPDGGPVDAVGWGGVGIPRVKAKVVSYSNQARYVWLVVQKEHFWSSMFLSGALQAEILVC